jgi:uncharacterized protein YycO
MRKISIVASQPIKKHTGSDIIMHFLGTNYSHVSWVFWDRSETNPFYYECVLMGGVKFTGNIYWISRNSIMFMQNFMVSDEIYDQFLKEAMDKCGEEYSLLQNIGIQIAKWYKLATNVFANGSDKSNCSELIYSFKDKVGLKIDGDPDLISPKDIVEACKKMQNSIEVA